MKSNSRWVHFLYTTFSVATLGMVSVHGLTSVSAADTDSSRQVVLGSDQLTQGIPGSGPLTVDEIKVWLKNPANHQVLDVELPLGLHKSADNIKGLDENPLTAAKIELGRQLYFDTRLSSDNTISCASCHAPDVGWAKETRFGVGVDGQEGNRNSPVSFNRIVSGPQFWDGRAATLEEQAVGPIANPIEMSNTHDVCIKTLSDIPGYKIQFDAIFEDGLNIDNVGKALASFERAIVTGPSPFDHAEQLRLFEEGNEFELEDLELLAEEDPELFLQYAQLKKNAADFPMSESAARGQVLFFRPDINCATCHSGANFADELYHNLGVGMDAAEPDLGRFVVTGEEKDKGAFKTPTLRNVAQTAPYMHDGSQQTLEEVVRWYAKGGHANPHLSDKIKKFEASEQDIQDLVEFMKALTGAFPEVCTDRLPE